MRIAVATLYTEGYRPLAELTNPHKIEYCQRHGYTPELLYLAHDPNRARKARESNGAFGDYNRVNGVITDPPDAHWAPAYERYEHVLNLLNTGKYDAVFMIGADAIIMNQNLTVDRLIQDWSNDNLIVTTDCNRFNDDNYIAINHELTRQFLWQMTRDGGARYEYHKHPCGFMEPYGCQMAAREYLNTMPYMQGVRWVPQREMNSNLNREVYGFPAYVQGQYEPGDWILHLPGIGFDQRMALTQDYLGRIQR